MPGCIVSATTASFNSVEKRRLRATPVITSTFENASDIGVSLGLCLGPPAIARVRSKRGALQAATSARLLYEKSFALGISAAIVAILVFDAAINLPRSHLFSAFLLCAAVIVFLTAIVGWSQIRSRASNPRYRIFAISFVLLCFA